MMRGRARTSWLPAAVLAMLAAMTACRGAGDTRSTEPDRVRAVVMPYLTFMPFHIARVEGLFEEQNLDVEFVRLERMQELMSGLARGDVDVAGGMLTVNVLNTIAVGGRLRIVGAMGHIGSEGCSFTGLVARKALVDSGALEDPEQMVDLRWDTDVLLPYGYWLDEAVRPFGLTTEDLELVNLPEAAAVEAIRNGSVDVTLVSEPFFSLLASSPEASVWRKTNEFMPDYQISVMMYGPTLLDDRSDVGERFAAAMLAASRQYAEGKTERNLAIVEDATGLTRAQIDGACWPVFEPDGRVTPDGFLGYQSWAMSHGFIERVLTEDEMMDHRFNDYANRVLSR